MDFCSDGLSYSSFFESFLAGDEKIMPARGGYLEAVEVDGICGVGIGILQIQKGRRTDTLWHPEYFSPLAITFKEGPGGIFDFFMSSLLSACCWKMELEAVDDLHKRANAS